LPVLIILLLSCFARSTLYARSLAVFAAAAARPAINQVCEAFEDKCGVKVEVNYGGGGEVLSRMILGKRGDVYIAPEQSFMATAREKAAVKPESVRTLAYMVPVIAVENGNPKHISGLADLARRGVRVAITRPETTLLGRYAPEIFKKAGLGEDIERNIVTYASDPGSLLTLLLMGKVDAGIIWHFYETLAPDRIEVILFPPEQLTGIGEMQVAISTYSRNPRLAQQFIDFVTSAQDRAIFREHGYIVDSEEVRRYWR